MDLNAQSFDLNEDLDGGLESDEGIDCDDIIPPNDIDQTNHDFRQPFIHMLEGNTVDDMVVSGEAENAEDVEAYTPKVGMKFKDGEELAAFLYTYAFKTGFEWYIRSNMLLEEYRAKGVKRNRGGEKQPRFHMFKRLRLTCKKANNTKRKKQSGCCGCKAVVECRIFEGETAMKITRFDLVHNHPTDPTKSRLMVSFRYISDYFKGRMMLNDAAGIPIVSNYNSLVLEGGGHENLPFNGRDVRNAINRERRKGMLDGDAAELEAHFERMQALSPEFFYSIVRDDDGKLVNVFWCDARCRAMCEVFGDVISYDTTFLCNRYHLPFSPFIGVNHHGNSVVLGAALISHEDAESFIWVFQQWLKCAGKAPSVILTDQDKAIGKAVRTVFVDTKHRLCLWHVMRNGSKNLGSHRSWKQIEVELKKVVHDSSEVLEFEARWNAMVEKFELQNNPWVRESFEIRTRWVPAYWMGTFCAGMSSTQRSEQQNRFFKSYVNARTGLINFIKQFDGALQSKVEEENRNNFASVDRPLTYRPEILVEDVFHKLYTNEKFKEVKEEVEGLVLTSTSHLLVKIGSFSKFSMSQKIVNPLWNTHRKTFEVSMDTVRGEFSCTCKLFEFKGILCRHIVRCIEDEDVDVKYIPERYIVDRWRKDIVRRYETVKATYYDPTDSDRLKQLMDFSTRNEYIGRLAFQDANAYAIYKQGSAQMIKDLEAYSGIDNLDSFAVGGATGASSRVWGHRRLQKMDSTPKVRGRNAVDGRLKDPVDKRKVGRVPKPRQKTVRKKLNLSQPSPSRSTQLDEEYDFLGTLL